MIREILLGLVLALVLLYLYYLYLAWAAEWSGKYARYIVNPRAVVKNDAAYLDTYSRFLPPEPIADGYKVINFWFKYYFARASVMI